MEREEWFDPDFPPPGWSRIDWEIYLDSEEDEDAN